MAERRKIYLTLHQCENWQELTDLLDSIKIATATIPLVPLARQPIKIGEKKYIRPVADDLEKWFYDNYNSNSEWDSELFDKFKTEHSISGLFTMPLSPEWNAEEPKLNAIGVTFDSGCFGAKSD